MNQNILLRLVGVLSVLVLVGWGIHGVINRKRINNLANLIISIGQIVCGIIGLIGIFILIHKGKL